MARTMSTGWQDVEAEHLGEIEGDEFEEFCASLIRDEAYDRHDGPDFNGPTGKGKDGGRDALLTVFRPPVQSKLDYQRAHKLSPLTEDPLAGPSRIRIAYSCKSDPSWLTLALGDANDDKRAVRAVEVLREGGYFKLLLNQRGKLDQSYKRGDETRTPREHLRVAFWERLKRDDPNAPDPESRIQILDASDLALWLRQRQPAGGDFERWLARLGLDPELYSLEQWRQAHVVDREQPPLVDDDARSQLRDEVLSWLRLSSAPPGSAACIIGKPGVGKTRLAIEALSSDPAIAQRVRAALSPREAIEAIDQRRLLRRHRDLVLVIDDCLVNEVGNVVARFHMAAQEQGRARLLLLVPSSYEHVEQDLKLARIWPLAPLDDEHCRELVAQRLERPSNDADVAALAAFAEGFPWFARLLAVEFEQEGVAPKVTDTSVGALRGHAGGLRWLVWPLEFLSAHPGGFEDGEAALFHLAQAERGPAANNAGGTWGRLFLIERAMTHCPLVLRLQTLHARMSDPSPVARRVALAGVEAVLTTRTMRAAPAGRAQPWPRPSAEEARAGRLQTWGWLGERFDDPDPSVGEAAKQLAIKLLRGALRLGVGVAAMDMLEHRVDSLTSRERIELRKKLEEVREYDAALLDPSARQPVALELALAPRSFAERLRQRVGTWGPASLRDPDADEPLDDALAREGLRGEAPLRAELPWLITSEAERGHMFAYAIGRCDPDGALFGALLELAQAHPSSWQAQALVARYLGGMVSVGQELRAEALADRLTRDPALATTAALALIELGANPQRLSWLEGSLHEGNIHAFAIEELGRRTAWLAKTEDAPFVHLLRAMAAADIPAKTAALWLFIKRFKGLTNAAPFELLEQLLEQLASADMSPVTAHCWELGAKMLCERGRAARVAEYALVALLGPNRSDEFAWNALHRAAEQEPRATFGAVARALEQPERRSHLLIPFQFHRRPFEWPSDELLEWVGEDEQRARAAAGIVRVTSDHLPRMLRELIRRFGPHGMVATEISMRMSSPGGVVSDIVAHDRQQLERARGWLGDPDQGVATFAAQLVEDFERSLERDTAYEYDLRRQYGT